MSGLVGFFKDFFPNVQNIDFGRGLKDLDEDERQDALVLGGVGSQIEYAEDWGYADWRNYQKSSLIGYAGHRLGFDTNTTTKNDNNDGRTLNSANGSEPENEEDNDYEYYDFKNEDHPMRNDEDQENTTLEGAAALQSQETMLGTQQDGQPQTQQEEATSENGGDDQADIRKLLEALPHGQRRRRRRIPRIEDAIHSIQTLEYLDLLTKDLSLDLCRVTKIWRLRDTRRALQWSGSGNTEPLRRSCPVFEGRMPRVPFGESAQDDGPLTTVYRHVLSLELQQLSHTKTNARRRNVRVFLYNTYAKAFWEWIEETQGGATGRKTKAALHKDLILSLSHVPAISIFPYALDPRNWREQEEMLDYCICIGDSSSMKIASVMEDTDYLRADSADLELRIASTLTASKPTSTKEGGNSPVMEDDLQHSIEDYYNSADELILSKDLLSDTIPPDILVALPPRRLLETWKEYQNSRSPPPPTIVPLPTAPIPTNLPGPTLLESDAAVPATAAAKPVSATTPAQPNTRDSSTSTTGAVTAQAPPAEPMAPVATDGTAALRAPPNRPPPPAAVCLRHRAEPMSFEGPTRKRPRRTFPVTNTTQNQTPSTEDLNTTSGTRNPANAPTPASPSVPYNTLISLKDLYASVLQQHVHQQSRWSKMNNLTVNLYAVVLGFTAPSQTKRGDWMLTASVVDDSTTVPVTLVIFAKHSHQLPLLLQTGDIIRLHRAFLQQWKGVIQLMGRKATSYVVVRKQKQPPPSNTPTRATPGFDTVNAMATMEGATVSGETHQPWLVVPTAVNEYSFDEYDEERSQSLWQWGQQLLREQPTINEEHRFTLGGMANLTDDMENQVRDRDLTVMITSILEYPSEAQTAITPRGFLRVWDGTGEAPSDPNPIPPQPIGMMGKNNGAIMATHTQQQEQEGDPPSVVLTKIALVIQGVNARRRQERMANKSSTDGDSGEDNRAPLELLDAPRALCGKVANVVIWEQAHWDLIQNYVEVGSFLRLRNVEVRKWKYDTFRSFMVHSKSWLSPLPDETFEVQSLLEEHGKRANRNEYNPMSSILPTVVPPPMVSTRRSRRSTNAPASRDEFVRTIALGDGLASLVSSSCNTRYKGIVQLLEPTHPVFKGNLKVFCTERDGAGNFAYQFVITVADASTSVKVLVPDRQAETILGISASKAVGGVHRETPFDPETAWTANIQSIENRGQRFFVLMNITEIRDEEA